MTSTKKKVCRLVATAILMVGLFCSAHLPALAAENAARVLVAEVERQNVLIHLDRIGTLKASAVVELCPRVSGQLKAVHFQEGQEVKLGDLLFSVDPALYQAELNQAEAKLAAARAQLWDERRKVKRLKALRKKDFVSQQNLEDLESQTKTTAANLRALQAVVEEAGLKLGYCDVKAPITGRTGIINVKPGNLVGPDITSTGVGSLVVIYQTKPMYVDFSMPEVILPEIRNRVTGEGLTVLVTPEGRDASYRGRTYFISPAVDDESGTIMVRGVLANKKGALWPGRFVHVRLVVKEIQNALVAPQRAVGMNQDGHYVYVVDAHDKAIFRKVEVGEQYREMRIVTRGLEVGEKVVTFGQLNLRPGMSVKVVKGIVPGQKSHEGTK
jgi:RND family efflux transporter MFP subunit